MPAPLNMPSEPGFTDCRWSMVRATGYTESPLTGHQQVQERDYALWRATLTLPPMTATQAGMWAAFFMQLRGRLGTFLLGNPDTQIYSVGGGQPPSVPVPAGAAVGANQFVIELLASAPPTTYPVLRVGDYFQIGEGHSSKLYMITSSVQIGRRFTTTFEPPLKTAIPPGARSVVHLINPRGVFRMTSNELGWSTDHMKRFGFTFSCQEAL